jgi:hypothetical protein
MSIRLVSVGSALPTSVNMHTNSIGRASLLGLLALGGLAVANPKLKGYQVDAKQAFDDQLASDTGVRFVERFCGYKVQVTAAFDQLGPAFQDQPSTIATAAGEILGGIEQMCVDSDKGERAKAALRSKVQRVVIVFDGPSMSDFKKNPACHGGDGTGVTVDCHEDRYFTYAAKTLTFHASASMANISDGTQKFLWALLND